jgi:formylmethanofuran dehydrogenase subunit B
VIAGLEADVAAIVAAFRLAEKLGAAIDHAGSDWLLREQEVLQSAGLMFVRPDEARRRADVLLVVGDRPATAWPELIAGSSAKTIVALGDQALELPDGKDSVQLMADAATLPGLLAALRARVNGRPLARDFSRAADVERAAGLLKAAAFGVAVWSPDELDALTIEMLAGLIKDLNSATRWSGLSVAPEASGAAAAMAAGWMTSVPLRATFARGRAEHDPWCFDVRRLVKSGEADAVVWIGALGRPTPAWLNGVPTVFIMNAAGNDGGTSGVRVTVGQPGRDHSGTLYDRSTGTLVEIDAATPSDLPTAGQALNRISAMLDAA